LLKGALNTIIHTENPYNIGVSSTPHHQQKSLSGPGIFLSLAMRGTFFLKSLHPRLRTLLVAQWWWQLIA